MKFVFKEKDDIGINSQQLKRYLSLFDIKKAAYEWLGEK